MLKAKFLKEKCLLVKSEERRKATIDKPSQTEQLNLQSVIFRRMDPRSEIEHQTSQIDQKANNQKKAKQNRFMMVIVVENGEGAEERA